MILGIFTLKDNLKSMNEIIHSMEIDKHRMNDYNTEYLYKLLSMMDWMMCDLRI